MKPVIFSVVLFLSIAATAAASTVYPANEKVMKTFNEVFKNANDPVWSISEDYYEVSFVNASVKTRAWFNKKGHLIQTIRYYNESGLPANVLYRIKQAYPRQEVCGVVEITSNISVNYRIVLKSDKKYTHINTDTLGETEIIAEYNRGDK